jgi:hypothetical protein
MLIRTPQAETAATLQPLHLVQVDLDERAFLFPAGKGLTRLVLGASGRTVHIDLVFAFNEARTPPRLLTLDREDVRLLGHALVTAVYTAKAQHAISDTMRISIDVLTNGYRLQIGDLSAPTELFLGTGCITRVCQGLLRIVDAVAPVEAN